LGNFPIVTVGILKSGAMNKVEIIAEVDSKGRVVIPKSVREKFGIKPRDRLRLKIVEAMPRRSFIKECAGALEGEGNAVELLHSKSPLRVRFKR